jgi:hypothetical protein
MAYINPREGPIILVLSMEKPTTERVGVQNQGRQAGLRVCVGEPPSRVELET